MNVSMRRKWTETRDHAKAIWALVLDHIRSFGDENMFQLASSLPMEHEEAKFPKLIFIRQ